MVSYYVAHQCLIKRMIRVTRCRFTSITYGTHIVEWRSILAVTKEDCRTLARTKEVKLGRRKEERTFRVRSNGALSTTVFTKGGLDKDGNCKHANFVVGSRHFSKSYEQTTYEIKVRTIKAQHHSLVNTIVLEGGVRGRFSEGFLQDNRLGTVVWETAPANCTDTFSQVYLGEVKFYKHQKQKDVGDQPCWATP